MAVILYGLDLSDTDDWWGWSIGGRGMAAGYVAPAARETFFEELKVAAGSPTSKIRAPNRANDYTTRYAYESTTGTGWHANGSPATSMWAYSGDDPAMSLRICCANPLQVAPARNEFVNWTWSETGTVTAYAQTVVAYPAIGQASFVMDNGFNNATPTFRSFSGGNQIPHAPEGARYVPCTAGVDIAFSADIRYRSSPGNITKLGIDWYNADEIVISNVALYDQANSGFETVTATLTPPVGAVKWRISLIGVIDNVTAAS